MQLLVAAAALVSVASAAFGPADSCTNDMIDAVKTSQCTLGVLGDLTVTNKVDLTAWSMTTEEIMAMFTPGNPAYGSNKTSNITAAFAKMPTLVAALAAANYSTPYAAMNAAQTEAYNNLYHEAVCPVMRKELDALTACIPKACNETTWAYCNNVTYASGIAGAGTDIAKYAVSLSAIMKIVCVGPVALDAATNVAKCKALFPASLFGTYVAPVTPTAPPTKGNGTSASSSVEIAVLAAASVVATTMLAF
jgi:hypothetical protein